MVCIARVQKTYGRIARKLNLFVVLRWSKAVVGGTQRFPQNQRGLPRNPRHSWRGGCQDLMKDVRTSREKLPGRILQSDLANFLSSSIALFMQRSIGHETAWGTEAQPQPRHSPARNVSFPVWRMDRRAPRFPWLFQSCWEKTSID